MCSLSIETVHSDDIVSDNDNMYVQGLLGIFFKIEAVALFEDIETALSPCEESNCHGPLNNVEYFSEDAVGTAYTNAAL